MSESSQREKFLFALSHKLEVNRHSLTHSLTSIQNELSDISNTESNFSSIAQELESQKSSLIELSNFLPSGFREADARRRAKVAEQVRKHREVLNEKRTIRASHEEDVRVNLGKVLKKDIVVKSKLKQFKKDRMVKNAQRDELESEAFLEIKSHLPFYG